MTSIYFMWYLKLAFILTLKWVIWYLLITSFTFTSICARKVFACCICAAFLIGRETFIYIHALTFCIFDGSGIIMEYFYYLKINLPIIWGFKSVNTLAAIRSWSILAARTIIWTLSCFAFVDVNTIIFFIIDFVSNFAFYKDKINTVSFWHDSRWVWWGFKCKSLRACPRSNPQKNKKK